MVHDIIIWNAEYSSAIMCIYQENGQDPRLLSVIARVTLRNNVEDVNIAI